MGADAEIICKQTNGPVVPGPQAHVQEEMTENDVGMDHVRSRSPSSIKAVETGSNKHARTWEILNHEVILRNLLEDDLHQTQKMTRLQEKDECWRGGWEAKPVTF